MVATMDQDTLWPLVNVAAQVSDWVIDAMGSVRVFTNTETNAELADVMRAAAEQILTMPPEKGQAETALALRNLANFIAINDGTRTE